MRHAIALVLALLIGTAIEYGAGWRRQLPLRRARPPGPDHVRQRHHGGVQLRGHRQPHQPGGQFNITLLPLPPKRPELNPVENAWQRMRENWLSNRVFPLLRRHSRPLLPRLEQTRRAALDHHGHRAARLGASVLIRGTWYESPSEGLGIMTLSKRILVGYVIPTREYTSSPALSRRREVFCNSLVARGNRGCCRRSVLRGTLSNIQHVRVSRRTPAANARRPWSG